MDRGVAADCRSGGQREHVRANPGKPVHESPRDSPVRRSNQSQRFRMGRAGRWVAVRNDRSIRFHDSLVVVAHRASLPWFDHRGHREWAKQSCPSTALDEPAQAHRRRGRDCRSAVAWLRRTPGSCTMATVSMVCSTTLRLSQPTAL